MMKLLHELSPVVLHWSILAGYNHDTDTQLVYQLYIDDMHFRNLKKRVSRSSIYLKNDFLIVPLHYHDYLLAIAS